MEANKALFSSRRADMFNQIFYGYGHQHIYDEGKPNISFCLPLALSFFSLALSLHKDILDLSARYLSIGS